MDGYFEMTKQEMISTVYRQLALDYNCQPEDFTRSGILFTEAKMQRGRREMPFVTPRLEVITMGKSTVVNASKSVMPYVKQKFRNKNSYEILTDKLVYGANPYYLPDIEHIKPMENAACSFVLLDKDLHGLYKNKGFSNALQYDRDSARPEVLAAVAYDQEQIVGIACVSADSQTMWQIGVDVRPAYRGNGIGVKLVNMLTIETLARGVVPYYTTDIANISSQKVAVKTAICPPGPIALGTDYQNSINKKQSTGLLFILPAVGRKLQYFYKPGGFSEVRPVCAWYSKTVCRATRTGYRQSPPAMV